MALMTLEDRIVLITSNLGGIQRAKGRGDDAAIYTFFRGIFQCAKEGADHYAPEELDNAPSADPIEERKPEGTDDTAPPT